MREELVTFLANELATSGTSWSVGEFGAVGEFHHTDAFTLDGLELRSAGATLRILPVECRPIAYETVSGQPGSWLHGVALCLPENRARMHCRDSITRLDDEQDAGWLFDLGLGLATVDFCVTTTDASVARRLRAACGSKLVEGSARARRFDFAPRL